MTEPIYVAGPDIPGRFGISERTVRDLAGEGVVERHYVGTKPVYKCADIIAWIERQPTEKRMTTA